MNMLILGLNAYHGDSSACIIKNGKIIAAAEEERFRRIKHWAGFPSEAIHWCLQEANATLLDVDHIAINSDPKAQLLKKVSYSIKQRPDLKLILDRVRNRRDRSGVEHELITFFPNESFNGKVHQVEHHLSHLASAHWGSSFIESVSISVDGFGDFSSAAWGFGNEESLSIDGRVLFPHSLGVFYQALTQFLGFPKYGDEYKVMGLAPYGKPIYLKALREILKLEEDGTFFLNLTFFRHHNEKVSYEWKGGEPKVGDLFNNEMLENLLGFARRDKDDSLEQHHKDLACSIQAMYEEAFFNLLNYCHKKYAVNSLTLAGGCAMNSVANGKVKLRSPFEKIYVQAAAGDAGGAIGAAMTIWNELSGNRPKPMEHAFLGPKYSTDAINSILESNKQSFEAEGCSLNLLEDEQLYIFTAENVADGKVVGWFQGRMEWGPRALGNRSILGDPRRSDMKDILNLKIKRRESFRPFAPSILREAVVDWFEIEDDVPFMMKVFQIKEEKRSIIPAVTHVDGSGRLQTVHQKTNPRYYRLIKTFADITGVPLILNTSFNENEPIVCHPQEAIDCFMRTKMDVLVLENWVFTRD